jgi:rSAM/selenodomain-associated transferase 2
MTGAARLHRIACVLFVAAAASAHLVAAAPPAERGARYVALHLVLSVLMLGSWATAGRAGPRACTWTLAAGVLARLALLGVPAFTSTDVVRYLWDGRVALAGLDPWRLSPGDPALAALAHTWPVPPTHTELTTIYPPGAMALFALAAATGADRAPAAWQLATTLASIATLAFVARLLEARSAGRHLPLAALSPLLVLEPGVGRHLDVFSALAVAGALALVERPAPAGAALGAGAITKLLPGLAVVPLAAARGGRAGVRLTAAALAVAGLGYGAALALGLRPLGDVRTFFAGSRFGSPLFTLLEAGLGPAGAAIVAAVLAALALGLAARVARAGHVVAGVGVALAAPLVPGPVVFPWYLLSLVPVVALAPSATLVAWLTAAPLTYETNDRVALTGEWAPAVWPLWAIGAAWVAGAAVDATRARRRRRRPRPTAPPATVCVVIPTLDEEARIGARLAELAAIPGVEEVIVVDGGSRDRTAEIARGVAGVRVLVTPRGRGTQLNAGARAAREADVLLFLHADVSLPPDATAWIATALAAPGVVAGAFRTRTVSEGGRRWLGPLLRAADLRSRVARFPYGDQALFVRRSAFAAAGGFPDQPLMEDLELSRRLGRLGRIETVPAEVRVSGRRFLARPLRSAAMMRLLPLLYRLGVPPRVLARLYGDPR